MKFDTMKQAVQFRITEDDNTYWESEYWDAAVGPAGGQTPQYRTRCGKYIAWSTSFRKAKRPYYTSFFMIRFILSQKVQKEKRVGQVYREKVLW